MRRWSIRPTLSLVSVRPTCSRSRHATTSIRHLSTTSAPEPDKDPSSPPSIALKCRRYAIFDTVPRPHGSVDAWMALLDGALPPHLRDWSNDTSPPILSALDVADILHEAQHPRNANEPPLDLLHHLGFNQGRWNAVVWLVKKLVQEFPVRHARRSRLSDVNALWNRSLSLRESTGQPLDLPQSASVPDTGVVEFRSLDHLTASTENCSPEDVIGHAALGQIWRTLGAMTKACAGQEIRPEVLEIIAFLHHEEVMPMSIYHSDRHPDSSAIQQPPLVSLLSSRILTSLSDAAWRAHEKLVIEEAKAVGGAYAALRPEIPGAVYRVRVAGLRPEVWIELILWSCLRGGWLLPGADILRSIATDPTWKPLSWQDYEQTLSPEDHTNSVTWKDWEYHFKMRGSSTRDAPEGPNTPITQTVSAELVNAFIDALAGTVDIGIGNRVIDIADVTSRLHELKAFLHKQGYRLTLSTGSWDALIIRLIESQGGVSNHSAATIQRLVSLSPGFSQGLGASNTQGLPSYVLDGNMALHGLQHRALCEQIAEESFTGALSIFNRMRNRIDRGRRQSLRDFMGHVADKHRHRPRSQALGADQMFTGNVSGIEYPELELQIPRPTLARLLDLATESKAYDFGRHLLYGEGVDGPVIGESLYVDRYVQSAVLRFAILSDDQELLSKLKDKHLLLRDSYRTVFNHQVSALKWDIASRMLHQLTDSRGRKWLVHDLANVVRAILLQSSTAAPDYPAAQVQLRAAKALFKDMIEGPHAGAWSRNPHKATLVRNLAAVLVSADPSWAEACLALLPPSGYQTFQLPARSFNLVLEGVVLAYGSAAGQKLLSTFWPLASRNGSPVYSKNDEVPDDDYRKLGKPPALLDIAERQRIVISVPGSAIKNEELIVYGSLIPNTETIMIILQRALDELADVHDESNIGKSARESIAEYNSGRDRVEWLVRRLAERSYVEASIVEQLRETLIKKGLGDLVSALPEIVRIAEADVLIDQDETAQAGENAREGVD